MNRSAMSIRNLKRFYTAEDASSFVVYDSAPTFATPDEETMSLTYESPKSTKSDLPRKKRAKRVRFYLHLSSRTCPLKLIPLPLLPALLAISVAIEVKLS